MQCKKHEWQWLYLPTADTDKIGWFTANLSVGGSGPKDDIICLNCGAIGWRRKSRYGNTGIYQNQMQVALKAVELAQRLRLSFPKLNV